MISGGRNSEQKRCRFLIFSIAFPIHQSVRLQRGDDETPPLALAAAPRYAILQRRISPPPIVRALLQKSNLWMAYRLRWLLSRPFSKVTLLSFGSHAYNATTSTFLNSALCSFGDCLSCGFQGVSAVGVYILSAFLQIIGIDPPSRRGI
jgi:hypothetical protein